MRYADLLSDLDKNHAAMGRDESVYSAAAAAIRQLLADVRAGDTAISQLEHRAGVLEAERDDARKAARWLLPFVVNEPRHLQAAIHAWPWLQKDESR